MAKAFTSEVVDEIIMILEGRLTKENKHLIKTDTILMMCRVRINLDDPLNEREELLEKGMRQVIQTRLFSHNYFSVQAGYFVNIDNCENLEYLNMIIKNKDETIKSKILVRNRIKELKSLNGQMQFLPDENHILTVIETKTKEEIIADLEADAI